IYFFSSDDIWTCCVDIPSPLVDFRAGMDFFLFKLSMNFPKSWFVGKINIREYVILPVFGCGFNEVGEQNYEEFRA
ncbi:MAG: hypothetical protein QXU48_05595, partial [Thermoplasmata archaeon]